MCQLEVSERNHHLQGKMRNLWTTISIWWPTPRPRSHLYRLCSAGRWRRPGGWPKTLKDKLSCHLTNVQAPHLCFSAEHFYQDLCKHSPTFWDVYILTARSQVLETGGGWQGPKKFLQPHKCAKMSIHFVQHPWNCTSCAERPMETLGVKGVWYVFCGPGATVLPLYAGTPQKKSINTSLLQKMCEESSNTRLFLW